MFERQMEYAAPKRKTAAEKGILAAAWIIILALVAFIVIKVSWIGGICIMLIIVPLYLNKKFTKEYAYVLTGDKLTVSVVDFKGEKTPIGNPVFLENLTVCAMESDQEHNGALKDTYDEVIDAAAPKSTAAAFAAFDRDGRKTLVRFEPSDMMIAEMKKYAEKNIFI